MPVPVSSSTSGPLASYAPGEVDTSPTTPTSSAPTAAQGDTSRAEAWSGEAGTTPIHTPDTCDATTAADLQRQYAQAVADRAALERLLDKLDDRLGALATAEGGFFSREVSIAGNVLAAGVSKNNQELFKIAARLPKDTVRHAVEERLREANPTLSREQLEVRTKKAMDVLFTCVKTEAAQRMRDLVRNKLEEAAQTFETTAAQPLQLAALAAAINEKEGPNANATQRAEAKVLRATLGLEDDGQRVTADSLASALEARAALMRREAGKIGSAGENTLYRALLTHDVRGLFASEQGVRAGSWAAEGLDAVHARGKEDEEQIATAKLVTSVALAGVTGGAGLGVLGTVLMGAGTTAAINAPEVLVAHHEVGGAAAGASAGTAAVDAEEVARRHAWLKTFEAAASTALGGALGAVGGAGGHEVESVVDHTAKHIATHMAAHFLGDKVLETAVHALEYERGEASGHDAVSGARRASGL